MANALRVEIAYRTQNLRSGKVTDHRKIVTAAKLAATLRALDEKGAYDVFTADLDAGAHESVTVVETVECGGFPVSMFDWGSAVANVCRRGRYDRLAAGDTDAYFGHCEVAS